MKKIFKQFKKNLSLYRYAFIYRVESLFSYDENNERDIIISGHPLKKEPIPKKIWMYWNGDNISDYILRMIEQVRVQNPDHQLVVMNDNTLQDYIGPINFVASDIPIANKSDIIRLEILKKHGGIWIDASTLFIQDISWVHKINAQSEHNLIGYYNDTATTDPRYPIIESWFLCAPPQDPLITLWLDILSPLKEMGSHAYYKMISERNDYADIKQKISNPQYLLVYLAQQIAMRRLSEFTLYAKRCEANAFLYQESVLWNSDKLARLLCFKKAPNKLPPLIKLTSDNRKAIERVINFKLVNNNSIIGRLYNNK